MNESHTDSSEQNASDNSVSKETSQMNESHPDSSDPKRYELGNDSHPESLDSQVNHSDSDSKNKIQRKVITLKNRLYLTIIIVPSEGLY